MKWKHPLFYNSIWEEQEREQRAKFFNFLALLPEALSQLRNFVLILDSATYSKSSLRPGNNRVEIAEVLFDPLLEARKRCVAMERFTVAVPSNMAMQMPEFTEAMKTCTKSGMWQVEVRYPFDSDAENTDNCYWLKHGLESDLKWWFDGGVYY